MVRYADPKPNIHELSPPALEGPWTAENLVLRFEQPL